ncbi:ABC transporter [Rothia sp. HMSC064D08]|uniref:ABC transporter ATP-binding protein n=1 Tax=Rothia sp. HMSC064D08 TaxID=1715104 RepID=UPI0008A10DDB|nr:ABC transporter ATP-binding protein [Rothia sp. HMSC064D08]OFN02187.1 ABC transporter [Rothia sp. HMSC064D08]
MTQTHAAVLTAAQNTTAQPIAFESVGQSFPQPGKGTHEVLRDISFTAAEGEIISVIGSSGCGKSTLLRAAAGLNRITSGRVRIGEREVKGLDDRVAIGFQEPRLLPWRTVADNVALGLPPGTPKSQGTRDVQRLLNLVGLSEYGTHHPREISGGMAQRVSLARALARNPGVLLLDEPFGALDALTRINMQDLLLDIHRQDPTTILLVTHDVEEALYLSDRVIVLGKNSADAPATIQRIVTIDTPRPRDRADSKLTSLRAELLAELGVNER